MADELNTSMLGQPLSVVYLFFTDYKLPHHGPVCCLAQLHRLLLYNDRKR